MNSSIQDVYASLKDIFEMIENYLGSIEEVSIGSSEISNSMLAFSELSIKNEESITILEKSISRFKT